MAELEDYMKMDDKLLTAHTALRVVQILEQLKELNGTVKSHEERLLKREVYSKILSKELERLTGGDSNRRLADEIGQMLSKKQLALYGGAMAGISSILASIICWLLTRGGL